VQRVTPEKGLQADRVGVLLAGVRWRPVVLPVLARAGANDDLARPVPRFFMGGDVVRAE
jgi:hypothetical protein